MEEWAPIAGHAVLYAVSTEGRVWSFGRYGGGRYLRPGLASNGYLTVALGRNNTRTVHSLVAEAFLGPRPSGCDILHADGIRTNPRLANLRYGTRTENIYDAVAHGTWVRGPAIKKAWITRRQRYGRKGVKQCDIV